MQVSLKKLNSILLFLVIIFAYYLLLNAPTNQPVSESIVDKVSATAPSVSPAPDPQKSTLINAELKVKYEPKTLSVGFVSDGFSGSPSEAQKNKFADGGAAKLISTPLNFTVDDKVTKLYLPGELVYAAYPKVTAPTDFDCVATDTPTEEELAYCLYNVSIVSVLSSSQNSLPSISNVNVVQNQNILSLLASYLQNVVNYVRVSAVPTDSRLIDLARESCGSVFFWGDDSFQQFVPIDPSANAIVCVESTAVTQSQDLFIQELSNTTNSSQASKYKSPNAVFSTVNKVNGQGQVFDPFTSAKPQAASIIDIGFDIAKLAFANMATKQNFFISPQTQRNISAHSPLRTYAEADEYNLKYNLCDALDEKGTLSGFSEYENPIGRNAPTETRVILDANGNPIGTEQVRGKLYEEWERYNRTDSKTKRCISAVDFYSPPESPRTACKFDASDRSIACDCAVGVAKGDGCDEFSVEEQGLSFEQKDKTIPSGLSAIYQNSVLNNLNPSDLTGPYLNYLSPRLCGRLEIGYKITPGKSYIYNAGAKSDSNNVSVVKSGKRFVRTDVINQYCVLGGVLSNLAMGLTYQSNFYSTSIAAGTINYDKDALTCDKKEVGMFGGEFTSSNNMTAGDKIVYLVSDNSRGKFEGVSDDVAVYHGYDIFPLSPFTKEQGFKGTFYKYNNSTDIRVVVNPLNNTPKYAIFTTSDPANRDPQNKDAFNLLLCKFPSNTEINYNKPTEKSLCKVIKEGRVLPGEVSMTTKYVKNSKTNTAIPVDVLTITYYDGVQRDEKDLSEKPIVTKFLAVIDETDVAKTIVSADYTMPHTTGYVAKQLSTGNVAFANFQKNENGKLTDLVTTVVNPQNADFEVDENTNLVTNATFPQIDFKSNICQSTLAYCNQLSSLINLGKFKFVEGENTSSLYLATVANGVGVIHSIAPDNGGNYISSGLFSYKQKSSVYAEDYDEISAIKMINGYFHIFLERSGYHIRVMPQSTINSNLDLRKKLIDECGTNCMLAEQMEFNPTLFDTDCSDYEGKGACGYDALGKLNQPNVQAIGINGRTGAITAWYNYGKSLAKSIFYSPDMLYAYNGLYSLVTGTEYSNVYMPKLADVKLKDGKTAKVPQASPVRFHNYTNGGMTLGDELIDRNGIVYVDPLHAMKADRQACIREYAKVTGINLYYNLSGLKPLDQRLVSLPGTITSGDTTSTDTSGYTSSNVGGFCEQTWCIPESIPFVNNPTFSGDANNEILKNQIASYLYNRTLSDPEGIRLYRENRVQNPVDGTLLTCKKDGKPCGFIDFMCEIASERQMPCTLLAAVWIAESSATRVQREGNPQFGCFLTSQPNYWTFENQVKCAANSIRNRYNEASDFVGKKAISGPSDQNSARYTDVYRLQNRGNGSCTPATTFSYVFQKYTPHDARINNDNQCNKGIIVRDSQSQYCKPGTNSYNDISRPATVQDWGPATATLPNIQRTLKALDKERLYPDNNRCYIGKSTPTTTDVSGLVKLEGSETGEFKMKLSGWGSSDAAANVYMALRLLKSSDGKTLEGTHVLAPGETFSFNKTINYARNFDQQKAVVTQTLSPWDRRNFYYNNTIVPGGGWCELATSIAQAAKRVKVNDARKLSMIRFVGRSSGQAPNSGFDGDISFWTHTNVTEETYNGKLAYGDSRLQSRDEYVSIWNTADNPESKGLDLKIRNPYTPDSGIYMVIDIKLSNDGIVTNKVYFARKDTGARPS